MRTVYNHRKQRLWQFLFLWSYICCLLTQSLLFYNGLKVDEYNLSCVQVVCSYLIPNFQVNPRVYPLRISASLTVWRCPFHHAAERPLLGRPEDPDFPDWRGSFHHAAERPLLGRPEVPDFPVCSLLPRNRAWRLKKGSLNLFYILVIQASRLGCSRTELSLKWLIGFESAVSRTSYLSHFAF